jgi:hypothetical protein
VVDDFKVHDLASILVVKPKLICQMHVSGHFLLIRLNRLFSYANTLTIH